MLSSSGGLNGFFSTGLERELLTVEIGNRGRELRSGGEALGGMAMMLARSNGLLPFACGTRLLSARTGVLFGDRLPETGPNRSGLIGLGVDLDGFLRIVGGPSSGREVNFEVDLEGGLEESDSEARLCLRRTGMRDWKLFEGERLLLLLADSPALTLCKVDSDGAGPALKPKSLRDRRWAASMLLPESKFRYQESGDIGVSTADSKPNVEAESMGLGLLAEESMEPRRRSGCGMP